MPFNFHDWDIDPELTGKLIGKMSHIGAFKKYVFAFEIDDKKVIHSWGFVHLNNLLLPLPFGTKVHITYKGMETDPEHGHKSKVFEMDIVEFSDKSHQK